MKLFCISFQKTGTSTLHHFLLQNGVKSSHSPAVVDGVLYESRILNILNDRSLVIDKLGDVIENFDAHLDSPWPGLYQELMMLYPDALFLMIERDVDSWWRSLVAHWSLELIPRRLRPYEVVQYASVLPTNKRIIFRKDEAMLKAAYLKHKQNVLAMVPKDRLLTINFEDTKAVDKLRSFTGWPLCGSFEHLNQRWSRSARFIRNLYSAMRNSWRYGSSY